MSSALGFFVEEFNEYQDDLAAGVRDAVAKAEAIVMSPITESWSKIEKAADRLVEKSSGLSREQAVDRVLRERPELYSDYLRATEAVVVAKASTDNAAAARTAREDSLERLAVRLECAVASGENASDALTRLLDNDPAVRAALADEARAARARGEDVPAGIAKALSSDRSDEPRAARVAYGRIEARAGALVEKSAGLTRDQAIALVLEREPHLYSDYAAALASEGN